MSTITRRGVLALSSGAVLGMAGCGGGDEGTGAGRGGSGEKNGKGTLHRQKLIGDGSSADTGPQSHQPKAERLEAGQKPPQFVVFSWDGAGELDSKLFARFRKVAKDHGAAMTFFLSGIYLLPESKKNLYKPPRNPVGASDIGYLTDAHIKDTVRQLRLAWLEGHEIGTHFNGHFCAGPGSVGTWTEDDWRNEIEQAIGFVSAWKTNTGFKDVEPLPFDYRKELIGARTPCLLGQDNLLPVAKDLGWRYDSSSPGGTQVWPGKKHGIWNFPLQSIPFPGRAFEVLSMDYNLLVNQSQNATRSDPANYPSWRRQARDAYVSGFERAYETNRAPLFIGNHFEQWNGGIYMDAVEEAIERIAERKDVRLVSFRQLTHWLDTQDARVLESLRSLGVGEKPKSGWRAFTKRVV